MWIPYVTLYKLKIPSVIDSAINILINKITLKNQTSRLVDFRK